MSRFLHALLLCMLVFAVGCASSSTGPKMDSKQVAQIQKGVTTRAEVVSMLGSPLSTTMLGDGRRMMLYHSMQASTDYSAAMIPGVAFFKGVGAKNRNQQLQIIIGRNDVVEDYEFSDTTSNTQYSGVLSGNRGKTTTVSNLSDP